MLIVRALRRAMDRRGSLRSFVDRLLHIALTYRIAPLLLAAPLAALLFATPWWLQWSGIPAPLYGFVPSFPSVAIFGTSVLFGWCLHRQQSLFEFLRRDYALYLIVAVLASFAALYLVGVRMNMTVIPMSPEIRAAYAGAYMLAVWCWSFGLVGAAMAWLSAPSARWRYLSDASYWMYLIHVPIVWGLQAWMIRWPLHWSIKYALILTIAGALLLASYHYLVRSTFIGKFLNGRKYPRALPLVAAAPDVFDGLEGVSAAQASARRHLSSSATSFASAPSVSPSSPAIRTSDLRRSGLSVFLTSASSESIPAAVNSPSCCATPEYTASVTLPRSFEKSAVDGFPKIARPLTFLKRKSRSSRLPD